MKFQPAINLERLENGSGMREIARHTFEMVQSVDISSDGEAA